MNTVAWGTPGPAEIGIIVVVLMLLFGVNKVPKMARAFGESLSAFKRGKLEGEKELRKLKKEVTEV